MQPRCVAKVHRWELRQGVGATLGAWSPVRARANGGAGVPGGKVEAGRADWLWCRLLRSAYGCATMPVWYVRWPLVGEERHGKG